jgi:ParB-like chromosome segregation protein Spo0J
MVSALKSKLEFRAVPELKPHPANAVFGDLPDGELKELADDLARRGQQHAIDILPDGTVVAGHQRWLAAKLLGWETMRCRVRYDLARAGDEAVEEYLLRDNFNRRQLTPLAAARVYRRLKALAKKTGRKIKGDVRDFISRRFGKSGRTLDRWARLLDAPIDVQNAVSDGKLKLLDGCRVVELPEEVQANIAEKIRQGADPSKVIQSYLGRNKSLSDNVGTLLRRLLRDLTRHSAALSNRVDEIEAYQWVDSLTTLEDGRELIERLCARIEAIAKESQLGEALELHSENGGGD